MRDQGKLSIFVTEKDYKLLLTATLLTQPYEGFVKRARLEGARYRLEFTLRQLKSFVRYLDFEKSWFEYGPGRRALRAITARLWGSWQLMSRMRQYTNLTS
ncbi:MAG: hypothetical protein A3G91_00275 [Omnitrophica WOR_2 bacterium RIFCSPLOWO2_12_FULL_50_9]|nr:MAG: hypothetical protein A3D87_05155 [Omnitrophica WOR_2 bacterium RIFCSPHIGHO2_02_FULL_50_17]OGX41928.1 MAG: hypothetical protein A3G91_00275 [Omnitrophica WOR_2 bacterium RIFCSPLOWO2_12_FULL_50_9]